MTWITEGWISFIRERGQVWKDGISTRVRERGFGRGGKSGGRDQRQKMRERLNSDTGKCRSYHDINAEKG